MHSILDVCLTSLDHFGSTVRLNVEAVAARLGQVLHTSAIVFIMTR